VHGFWVGREDSETLQLTPELTRAKQNGVAHLQDLAQRLAQQRDLSIDDASRYFSSFSYGFGQDEEQGLSEFIRYAYFHGVLPDIPDINFFEIDSP
jgi:predicted solute-binding protein